MTRFYIPNMTFTEGLLLDLQEDHVVHLRVLRASLGDEIFIFNERGEWQAHLKVLDKKKASVLLGKQVRSARADSACVLYFGLCKKKTTDFILEKGTEMGVTHFYPFISEYSQHFDLNIERCDDILISAIEQCERLDKPLISPVSTFDDVLKTSSKHGHVYMLVERSGCLHLSEMIRSDAHDFSCLMVGAEGGFSKDEISKMEKFSHIIPVGLSDTILRAETAVISGLSLSLVKKSLRREDHEGAYS